MEIKGFTMRILSCLVLSFISHQCFFIAFGAEKTGTKTTEKAASMLAVRNKVEAIIGNASTRILKPKDSVFTNEIVTTRKRSRAQMMFIDKSIVGIGPDSELVIEEYIFNSKNKSGKLILKAPFEE